MKRVSFTSQFLSVKIKRKILVVLKGKGVLWDYMKLSVTQKLSQCYLIILQFA